jgi:hypothetical protein
MFSRKSVAEMAGEFFREAAVLVIVFYPLEKMMTATLGSPYLIKVLGASCLLWVIGAVIEKKRKS